MTSVPKYGMLFFVRSNFFSGEHSFMNDAGSATAKEGNKFENVGDKEEKQVDRYTVKCNRDGIIERSVGPGQSADDLIRIHILREDAKKP